MERLEELLQRTVQLGRKGYVSGSSGNVSMRLPGGEIVISSTGAELGQLTERDMVSAFSPDRGKMPSKELPMHLSIYEKRPDLHVLSHLHPTDCIAAGILLGPDQYLPIYVPAHYIRIGKIPQIGLYKAGSEELAKSAANAFERANAVLLYRHGVIVGGENVSQACDRTEYLVEACRLHLQLKGYGAMGEGELESYIKADR